MKTITPFLWFDTEAEAAATFYTSIFKNSRIGAIARYGDAGPGPKGSVMLVNFQLAGQDFMALNGGPQFKFTPAISFFVGCKTEKEVEALWSGLSAGGTALMPLDTYPFSRKFGWVQDKFGVSWQLNLAEREQPIAPFLLFTGKQHGKAGEAMALYTSVFGNSRIVRTERFGKGEPGAEGFIKHGVFSLNGQDFMCMDSNADHGFTFTLALSFFVNCDTQQEVDKFWEKLSDGGQTLQCGWLQDRYGVAWQIVPVALSRMIGDRDPVKSQRVMKAMLTMNKLDIGLLSEAYNER